MNELQYIFNAICQRRGVTLQKVESLFFSTQISFGLATGTFLLPVVPNTFYVVDLNTTGRPSLTGAPSVQVTNSGQGSGGAMGLVPIQGVTHLYPSLETDSLQYVVNTFSAGSFYIGGRCFKITYS